MATIDGTDGNDTLNGSAPDANGSGGADVIHGKGGNDVINGHLGRDQLYGDAGDDTFPFDLTGINNLPAFSIDGGDGYDTLDFRGQAVNVTLTTGSPSYHGNNGGQTASVNQHGDQLRARVSRHRRGCVGEGRSPRLRSAG